MGEKSGFIPCLLEMLEDFGDVTAKAMFGGYGLYRNGRIFAIVVDDTLYIKADNKTRKLFEKKGLTRFSYLKKGKECFMSYYTIPEETSEDKEALLYWAERGYEAALRA